MAGSPSFPAPAREDWMCQYTGKLCYNPRASSARRHGATLLRLCAFHRALANRNQYRYQQRQRTLRRLATPRPPMATLSTTFTTHSSTRDSESNDCSVAMPAASTEILRFSSAPLDAIGMEDHEEDDIRELIDEVDALIQSWAEEDEHNEETMRDDHAAAHTVPCL